MNPENIPHLCGTVHPDPRTGDVTWTRWPAGGSGRVLFWMAVSRELAGNGFDLLLCAIEPKNRNEIDRFQEDLRAGRMVEIFASARQLERDPSEDRNAVVFIAEDCGFDGGQVRNAHLAARKQHARGKLAAAGDHEDLLPLGGDA